MKDKKITHKWLKWHGACEDKLNAFNEQYPNGAGALETITFYLYLGYQAFASRIVDNLPFDETPLKFENVQGGYIFYPGNVYINGTVNFINKIYIKGNLNVKKQLIVKDKEKIYAKSVQAKKIDISDRAFIYANCVNANTIDISKEALIYAQIEAKMIMLLGGHIRGNVEAKTIHNNKGLIFGDVKADEVKLINDGKISGNIQTQHLSRYTVKPRLY